MIFSKLRSITPITREKIKDAIRTNMALFCNEAYFGQVTLFFISSIDSTTKFLTFMILLFIARAERFELPSMVLETTILPLNYARLYKALQKEGKTSQKTLKKQMRFQDKPEIAFEFFIIPRLVENFSYLTSTYSSTTLTDSET